MSTAAASVTINTEMEVATAMTDTFPSSPPPPPPPGELLPLCTPVGKLSEVE